LIRELATLQGKYANKPDISIFRGFNSFYGKDEKHNPTI
jgi:hypothetical protein